MSVRFRLVAISLCAVILTLVACLTIQVSVIREQGTDLTRSAMRSILIGAENMRQSVSKMREQGAFNPALIADFQGNPGRNYRDSKLYLTVPVVSAWQSIRTVAEHEQYRFRIAANSPRNTENTPSSEEQSILDFLERTSATEYFNVDSKSKEMIYARPVRLTQDCMGCHGDPGTSPTHDGKDVLGFKMENWHVGEMHGAFILKASTDRLTPVIRASMGKMLLWSLPVAILVGILVFVMVNALGKRLSGFVAKLNEGSQGVSSAVSEITAASENVARGASENAAALQETSASSSEIDALAMKNSEHASLASSLVVQSQKNFDQAREDLDSLVTSMNGINDSAGKISHITKAVEDIALQTNLLALNAAVEAARAGEAGAGFAVVADEVRNLAGRSAKAARETTELIHESITRTQDGRRRVTQVAQSIRQIIESSQEIKHLIEQVSDGSREQVRGARAIVSALERMNASTQSTAASAEETASSAKQMDAQAETLKHLTMAMVGLMDGSGHQE